jgi:phosphotransferase system HPr (HPr) family protein
MFENKIIVKHKAGLHARPASQFVQTAKKFASHITVANLSTAGQPVDAKSILMVLTLGVNQNNQIQICADGADEQDAVQKLSELVINNFGETD